MLTSEFLVISGKFFLTLLTLSKQASFRIKEALIFSELIMYFLDWPKEKVLYTDELWHTTPLIYIVSQWSSEQGSKAKHLNHKQALSSHPHQQIVWMYWLQDKDSMPKQYTINHPTKLHTHTMKPSDPMLLADDTLHCRMYPMYFGQTANATW